MRKILLLLTLLFTSLSTYADFGAGWKEGAAYHDAVIKEARDSESPAIVYLHAFWCPWCKRLNEQYLSDGSVQGAMQGLPKVAVDPEKEPDGKRLMSQYHSRGYPSFMVVMPSATSYNPRALSPFHQSNADSPSVFADTLRKEIARAYTARGQDFVHAENYDKAIDVLKKAVAEDAQSYDANFHLGMAYHKHGSHSDAQEYLKKALEIQPNGMFTAKIDKVLRKDDH